MEKGGIIIAPRRSGKSTAILHFLKKHKNFAVSCVNQGSADCMKESAVRLFGTKGYEIKERIRNSNASCFVGRDWKLIIDEAFFHPIYLNRIRPFHCALSSSYDNIVLYNEKGKRLSLKQDKVLEISKYARDHNKKVKNERY